MSSPEPLEFFCASFNNGVWLYDKRAKNTKTVFDAWKGMICRVLLDSEFRREVFTVNPAYGTYVIQDEIIYRTLAGRLPNSVHPVSPLDNYLFQWIYRDDPKTIDDVRGVHCLSFVTGHDRRRVFLVIQEFWAQVMKVFDRHDIAAVFGDERPGEMLSLKSFYRSMKTIEKFLTMLDLQNGSCLKGFAQVRYDDDVRLHLL